MLHVNNMTTTNYDIRVTTYPLTSSNWNARLYKAQPLVSKTLSCFRMNKNII